MIIFYYEDIIKLYRNNRTEALKQIKNIIGGYYGLSKIKNISIIHYIKFIPLPSKLKIDQLDTIIFDKGKYKSCKQNNYIVASDISLPHSSISPIPFTIPYISNETQLIKSNVYYYEITIDKVCFLKSWDSMNVSIGFGTTATDMSDNILGWTNESIGYNSFNGSIYGWSLKDRMFSEYGLGDTVGAGLIYITNNTYDVFFTLNGVIYSELIRIETKNRIIPMIGLNYNASISINFNKTRLMYDYRDHILPIVISTNNIFIKERYDTKSYQID